MLSARPDPRTPDTAPPTTDWTTPDSLTTRRECQCRRARHRHGTRNAYLRDRCRCRPCRAANNAHQRALQRARAAHAWRGRGTSPWASATGIRRRLQALTASGWSSSQLGDRLGVSKSAVAQLRSTGQARVLATTAVDIAALYEACWWRTPPGRYQARAERYAEARDWVPPWRWDGVDLDDPEARPREDLADVDQVAMEETIAGRRVPLTTDERYQVIDALQRRGATSAEIAERLGCSIRTVERYEAVARAAPLQRLA